MAVFCLTTLPRVILSSIIMARLSSNNVIRNNGIRENTRRSYTTIFTLIENHLHSHGLLISYGRTCTSYECPVQVRWYLYAFVRHCTDGINKTWRVGVR